MANNKALFSRTINAVKRLFGYGKEEDSYVAFDNAQYGTDLTSAARLKTYQGIVYACVSLIGEQCGSYEPILERRNGDQWEQVNDHDFFRLLEQPHGPANKGSTNFSKFDLFQATGSFLSLQGESFWYLPRGGLTGRPKEIILLRADKVGIAKDDNGEIVGYYIRRTTGKPIPLEIEEVLHFKDFNPNDPYRGMGDVEGGRDYIAADEGAASYTKNFFKNNAGITGILGIQGEITKDGFKKFAKGWRERHEGTKNFGKVAILRDSEANFTKVGLGLNELDMNGLRGMTLDDVAMIFRVPLPLLGRLIKDVGLGRGNVETYEYIFSKYNIDVKFKRFDDVLQFALERYYRLQPGQYRVTHKNIIPADKEYELSVLDKAVDRWITRNEIRDAEGKDKIDGGDQLFALLNQVPINVDAGGGDTTATQAKRIILTRKKTITTTGEPESKKKKRLIET